MPTDSVFQSGRRVVNSPFSTGSEIVRSGSSAIPRPSSAERRPQNHLRVVCSDPALHFHFRTFALPLKLPPAPEPGADERREALELRRGGDGRPVREKRRGGAEERPAGREPARDESWLRGVRDFKREVDVVSEEMRRAVEKREFHID